MATRHRRIWLDLIVLAVFATLVVGMVIFASNRIGFPFGRKQEAAPASVASPGEHLVWTGDTVRLEQPDPDAVVFIPTVSIDPFGGFLMADEGMSQVRRYSARGELLWRFGRKGGGPNEFHLLNGAVRTSQGSILATQFGNKIKLIDPAGSTVTHILALAEEQRVSGAQVFSDDLVLIGTRWRFWNRADKEPPMLHLWSLQHDSIVRSFFFTPPVSQRPDAVYSAYGWTNFAVRGDSIAAAFSLADTIYILDAGGRPAGKLQIPFRDYRSLKEQVPAGGTQSPAFRNWQASFSFVSDIWWLADGSFLLTYTDMIDGERHRTLAHVSRNGNLLFEFPVDRVIAVDQSAGVVWFSISETADVWAAARLKA